jgi:hypothetical protein
MPLAVAAFLLAVTVPAPGALPGEDATPPSVPGSLDLDLRRLAQPETSPSAPARGPRHRPRVVPFDPAFRDPVAQTEAGEPRIPAPVLDIGGIGVNGFLPEPDPIGEVGPSHYVQVAGARFAIFSKAGATLVGSTLISSLWQGQPAGPCRDNNDGSGSVLYDPLADRFVLSHLPVPASNPRICIAVSKTADPVAGGFWLYQFDLPAFASYPRLAVWPDAYFLGAEQAGDALLGAFQRAPMLSGAAAPAQFRTVALGDTLQGLLVPADLDGQRPPAASAPALYLRHVDGEAATGADRLEIYEFDVDFTTPANTTVTGPTSLAHAAFASLCGFSTDCIPQPGTTQRLESWTEYPMWRLQYRNFAYHETLVGNHAVDAGGGRAGVRWFELRRLPAGAWTVRQDATWAPGTEHRWMGSAALDQLGNLAVGCSTASDTVFPSLRYAGRLAADPLNQLSQGEGVLVNGGGSQLGGNVWGRVSALALDPVDDCTFWYTGEYFAASSAASWSTRIGAFRFPGLCGDLLFRDGFQETGA